MRNLFCFLFVALVSLTACQDSTSYVTPTSSGRAYEMLVVIDKDMYERPAGRALHDALVSDVPGLPQPEGNFKIMTIAMKNFDRTFKMFRNIIVVDIDPARYTQTRFKYVKDVNSAPQMILTIQSPSESEFADFVYNHGNVITDFFVRAELNRGIKELEHSHSPRVARAAKEMFGCQVCVPTSLDAVKTGEDFFWASESQNNQLNFCMYSYPYVSSDIFTDDYFVHKRDSVMEKNIPGSREGMHMATQFYHNHYMVESENIAVRNTFCQQVRGLWHITKDNMGGPFISHVRVDTVNHKVIVAEGFVYKPNESKRNQIRSLESALYTLQLPADETASPELANNEIEESNDIDNRIKNRKDKQ
ncbi:MAG: DUF4837 family protein [Bacteroidaceae bacterium]|nr:DUF4837 family protein [Bacteroidaceae bacterium]